MDIFCQAKSGMGKTTVFVLATLHQLKTSDSSGDVNKEKKEENNVQVLVMCHTCEFAFQISHEYERFSKYLQIKRAVFYGGVRIHQNRDRLKNDC